MSTEEVTATPEQVAEMRRLIREIDRSRAWLHSVLSERLAGTHIPRSGRSTGTGQNHSGYGPPPKVPEEAPTLTASRRLLSLLTSLAKRAGEYDDAEPSYSRTIEFEMKRHKLVADLAKFAPKEDKCSST